MRELLAREAHLEWFEEFFGARPDAHFTVALGLLNGGQCYGPHCRTADGREDLYCILGVWETDDEGLPVFRREVLGTVVHEFCHSFTNRVIDRHEAELRASGEKLFAAVRPAMERIAYGNWKTMLYESLVRASTYRYLQRHEGIVAATAALEDDKRRQFLWIEKLADLLGQYEKSRDRYATLDEFAPRIVAFFDEHADEYVRVRTSARRSGPRSFR